MEASASSLCSSSTVLLFSSKFSSCSSAKSYYFPFPKLHRFFSPPIRTSTSLLPPSALVIQDDVLEASAAFFAPSSPKEMLPKIDKSGRFCSPRAARELALYAFISFSFFFYIIYYFILIFFVEFLIGNNIRVIMTIMKGRFFMLPVWKGRILFAFSKKELTPDGVMLFFHKIQLAVVNKINYCSFRLW